MGTALFLVNEKEGRYMGTYREKIIKGPDGLTELQRKFCQEYIKDYNGTQAYLRAKGPQDKPISVDCARTYACRTLKLKEVLDYIHKLQKEAFAAQCVNFERIADELSKIAFDPNSTKKDKMQALALLQKQMGLDKQVIQADVNQTVEIVVNIDEN